MGSSTSARCTCDVETPAAVDVDALVALLLLLLLLLLAPPPPSSVAFVDGAASLK